MSEGMQKQTCDYSILHLFHPFDGTVGVIYFWAFLNLNFVTIGLKIGLHFCVKSKLISKFVLRLYIGLFIHCINTVSLIDIHNQNLINRIGFHDKNTSRYYC